MPLPVPVKSGPASCLPEKQQSSLLVHPANKPITTPAGLR